MSPSRSVELLISVSSPLHHLHPSHSAFFFSWQGNEDTSDYVSAWADERRWREEPRTRAPRSFLDPGWNVLLYAMRNVSVWNIRELKCYKPVSGGSFSTCPTPARATIPPAALTIDRSSGTARWCSICCATCWSWYGYGYTLCGCVVGVLAPVCAPGPT